MIDAIIGFVQRNPFLVFAVLFFLYNKWKSSQPWPDFGGRITKIHSVTEWKELLAKAEKAGRSWWSTRMHCGAGRANRSRPCLQS